MTDEPLVGPRPGGIGSVRLRFGTSASCYGLRDGMTTCDALIAPRELGVRLVEACGFRRIDEMTAGKFSVLDGRGLGACRLPRQGWLFRLPRGHCV